MINSEECVQILSDDDVLETEKNRTPSLGVVKKNRSTRKRTSLKVIDTIVLDDENVSQSDNSDNSCIIEINDNDCIQNNNAKSRSTVYDKIYKENKILAEFIEKCLDLEHSEGMLRIINKTLLRVYKESDEAFKNSPEFEKVLNKAINLLETEPNHKFLHVKNLCETLTLNAKKRAKLITLATNLKGNSYKTTFKRKNGPCIDRIVKRPKKDIIIDLEDEQKDITVINRDEHQNDVIILDEPMEIDTEKKNEVGNELLNKIQSENKNKDVSRFRKAEIVKKDNGSVNRPLQAEERYDEGFNRLVIVEAIEKNHEEQDVSFLIAEPKAIGEVNKNKIVNKENSEDNKFLVAQVDVPWESSPDASFTSTVSCTSVVTEINTVPKTFESDSEMIATPKIKAIERKIGLYKRLLSIHDKAEVCDDTVDSPYIKSEKLKARIVACYKELCTITGQLPVKRREVRLRVREGHPSGPVKLLETFINNSIGSDGVPPFPDFSDVVRCVIEANETGGLCWSKAQIMNEANGLFTQCGRALQKQRQRREWRDLMSSVTQESVDLDPADLDPLLLAKLEENRRIGLKNEQELFERYAMMQTRAPKANKPGISSANAQGEPLPTQNVALISGENLIQSQGHPRPTLGKQPRPTLDETVRPTRNELVRPTQDELVRPTQELVRSSPGEHVRPSPGELVRSSPGELVRSSPGELVRSSPGELVRSSPGELVRSSPGELVRPSPGELVRPSPGELVRSSPGELVRSSPGELVRSSPGELVRSSPGELVRSSPGELVRSSPGELVRSSPGELVRPSPGELVRSSPGELVRSSPGELVRSSPGELVRSSPGELVRSSPGELVRSSPGELVRSSPGELVRPSPGELVRPSPGELVRPSPGELVRSSPGELVRSSPGELVRPSPGELVRPSPGELVRSSPGELVRSSPGELVRSSPGELVRSSPGELVRSTHCKHLVPLKVEHPELTQCIVHRSTADSDITPNQRNETKSIETACNKMENSVNVQLKSQVYPNLHSKIHVDDNSKSQYHYVDRNHVDIDFISDCSVQSNQDHVGSNLRAHVESMLQAHIVESILQQGIKDFKTKGPNLNIQDHGDSKSQGSVGLNSKSHLNSNFGINFQQSNEKSNVQSCIDSKLQSQDLKCEVSEVKIKQEPVDVAALLEELGDNYSATIFDIEDPFLVIDISSDSSDED